MRTSTNLKSSPTTKPADLLFWLALIAQGVAAVLVARPWMTGDSAFYISLAGSIDHGQYGRLFDGSYQPDALRPPGYPIILWLLIQKLNLPILMVPVFQVAAYICSILLIDRFLSRRGINSIPFRVLAVLYPFGALYSAFVMTEAWVTLALTLIVLLISRRNLTAPVLVLAGVIAGAAALVRADLIFLPLIIGLVVIWREWKSRSKPAVLLRALTPALLAIVVLSPYALWNAQHFGRLSPIPVAAALGNSLYLATWQGKVPLEDLNALYGGVATPRAEASGLADEMARLNASFGAPPQTAPFNPASYPTPELQIKSSQVFRDAALRRIHADPRNYARHVLRNLWALWNTTAYPDNIPAIAQWGLILSSAFVFVAGLAGVLLSLLRKWPIEAYSGLILFYPMVLHLPLHSEARYTAAVRPLLLMYASFAVLWAFNWYRARTGAQTIHNREVEG